MHRRYSAAHVSRPHRSVCNASLCMCHGVKLLGYYVHVNYVDGKVVTIAHMS
jgi:hypothetical protein